MSSGGCIERFYQHFQNLNFERSRRFGTGEYDPAHLKKALEKLGHPERSAESIHIAGTLAKGSTAHYLSRMLTQTGRRCGLYTSPHLENLTERIAIDETQITEAKFCAHWERLSALYNTPQEADKELVLTKGGLSFFDALTAIAMLHFQENHCDVAVYETGLGGLRDSTNNLDPEFCVITPIDYDHTEILGDTLEKIATEKAGILKPGVKVYLWPQADEARQVIEKRARQLGAPLIDVGGEGATNLEICREIFQLHFKKEAPAISGEIKGRFEQLSRNPAIFFDMAHTPRAMQRLSELVSSDERFSGKPLYLYFNCMIERDPVELLGAFFEGLRSGRRSATTTERTTILFFLNYTQELHSFGPDTLNLLQNSPETKRLPELARALAEAEILKAGDFQKSVQEAPADSVHLVAGSSRLYGIFSG